MVSVLKRKNGVQCEKSLDAKKVTVEEEEEGRPGWIGSGIHALFVHQKSAKQHARVFLRFASGTYFSFFINAIPVSCRVQLNDRAL